MLEKLNSQQRKTLGAIFENPTRSDIKWERIASLLFALDAKVSEGRGSRVRIELNQAIATFHRPHPKPTTKKYMVRKVQDFLIKAGVQKP